MVSEKLKNLILEFASDGVISENELALLKEKARDEFITQNELKKLIDNALLNSTKAKNDASGFVDMPKNANKSKITSTFIRNPDDNNKKSGFVETDFNSQINKASGFVMQNEEFQKLEEAEKSIFSEQEEFFKNENLLSNQGSMSEISIGTRHIRKVVIKRLKKEDRNKAKYIELLYKEFQNSLSLEHPNIVRVYDSGEDTKGPYYYMEFIDGRELSLLIRKFGIQNHNLIKKIAIEILSALSYVHKKQVFHRDLKPENILITYKGDNTKILDFGLSLTDDFADNMQKVGTPKYSAPEQFDTNFQVDGRSDLYSFGLILCEMLTGSIDNLDKVSSYSKKLRKIIEKCTENLAHNRYFTASDVILEIEKLEIIGNKFRDTEKKKEEIIKLKKTLDTESFDSKKIKTEVKSRKQKTRQIKFEPPIKSTIKKKRKTSFGMWLFFIIILLTAYYIGSELDYWDKLKNRTTYSENQAKEMYITANKLRLRSSKSLKIKNVIGLYHKGTKLKVFEIDDDWAKVKIKEKEGYMAFPKKYLSEELEK